ncbi:AzlC family ABC transporter permease [Pendulispora albinea]|uniref:AzlC family ABC transporter permease n=1 Tax=Pendulispora albinea TaxID=2741071 RepID=A0ABZ2M5U1_9BACT
MANSRSNEFFRGVRRELPLQLGVAPFGMIYGVLAVHAGMSPLAAQLSSSIVFAGSAQLVIAQMLGAGGNPLVVALTAVVLNVRHVLYSASMAPNVAHLPRRWRVPLAYLLTDEAYAVAIGRYAESRDLSGPDYRHWHYLGAGLTLWTTWQLSTLMGVLFGAQLSPAWGLDFAIPLTFIALLVPSLADGASRVAALTGAVASVLLFAMPLKLGLFCAMLVGIAAGAAWEVFTGGGKPAPNAEGTRA